jgi:LacI family gluconate utilization system Gnt-I transcriptional repressor
LTSDRNDRRGKRSVRVEDVARVAGVSPITVSRALSYPDKVREETRQRILAAVAETGYVINSFASSLRSGRSPIVAVFSSNLRNHHFANVLLGCTEVLENKGFQLLTARVGESAAEQHRIITSMTPFRPAAMLFTDLLKSELDRSVISAHGIPVVEMWDQRPDPVDMLVTMSEEEAGKVMGRHFGERGFTRIAYAGQMYDRGQRRVAGFRAALAEFGNDCELVVHVERGWDADAGVEVFDEVLSRLPGCDAIFFGTDMLAAGALQAARSKGIRVPGDIAVAGFGDIQLAAYLDPPLTSLHLSSIEMGRRAGHMLLQRLGGQPVGQQIVRYPAELRVRPSSGA